MAGQKLLLHQLLAVYTNGKQIRLNTEINSLFHGKTQQAKAALFHGSASRYTPLAEQEIPSTTTVLPIVNLVSVSQRVAELWGELADTKYAIELGNTKAFAPLRDDAGKEVSEPLPAIFLMPLRTILQNAKTYIVELVTLDPAVKWSWSEQLNMYEAEPVHKERTKLEKRVLTLSPATDKHPAQVQAYDTQVRVGDIAEIKYSTAIPSIRKVEMLDAIDRLIDQVTKALEEANRVEIEQKKLVTGLLRPIFELMKKPVA